MIDYLQEATKKLQPSTVNSSFLTLENQTSTQIDAGYFVNPQHTISGVQKAYVGVMQQIPWLGKSLAYRKYQKYVQKNLEYSKKYQLEQLKFKVKKLYYQIYQYKKENEGYTALTEKYRIFIKQINTDSLLSVTDRLKGFEYELELSEYTKKLQLVEGEYQNAILEFNTLLHRDSFEDVSLPFQLAMPEEEVSLSFADAYDASLFHVNESEFLVKQQIEKYNNAWLPTVGVGLQYTQVSNQELKGISTLRAKDIIEPKLQLKWNLFRKNNNALKKVDLEALQEYNVTSISNNLQQLLNDKISARVSYDTSVEKLNKLEGLKQQLTGKILNLNQKFHLEILKIKYEIEQHKAVSEYYIISSKMLLFQ